MTTGFCGGARAVKRSGRPDPHSDRLTVFRLTCQSSGTVERRDFAWSIRVIREGPDALSICCLVRVHDADEITQTNIDNRSKAV
jgi:hypothetical protein